MSYEIILVPTFYKRQKTRIHYQQLLMWIFNIWI